MNVCARLSLLALVVASAACGGSQPAAQPTVSPATVSSVNLQPADVANGLQECSMSGTMDHWLESIKTLDPTEYSHDAPDWQRAQQIGATASSHVIYAGSAEDCAAISRSYSSPNAATITQIGSLVIQFKDEKSAASLYNGGSFLGIGPKSFGANALSGTQTGLGPNSVVVSMSPIYIAYWQRKTFVVRVGGINTSNTIGTIINKINGRIH